MSNYIPKVGDQVYVTNPRQSYTVIGQDYKKDWVVQCNKNGTLHIHHDFNLSIMPTEEEKMIDELADLINRNITIFGDDVERVEVKRLYAALTLAGWHNQPKVKAVSRKDWVEIVCRGEYTFERLAKNNHIIVKDGELNQ